MKQVNKLEKLKHEFLEYLEVERARSSKTVENYDRYLRRFLKHTNVKTPAHITKTVVDEYAIWLNSEVFVQNKDVVKGVFLKKKTQNYHLIALRSFLVYLYTHNITSLLPKQVTLQRSEESGMSVVTHEELSPLLSFHFENDLKSVRDKAIVHLLFSTGLRVSELCALHRDVDLLQPTLLVRGKGGRARNVTLTQDAKEAVHRYVTMRQDTGEALFVNNGKRASDMGETRLSPRSVQRIVKFYAEKAGISKKITPQALRHACATRVLEKGLDTKTFQKLMGHENISTTQAYTQNILESVNKINTQRSKKAN